MIRIRGLKKRLGTKQVLDGVDLDVDQAVVGPWVTFDNAQGCFVGEFAQPANELSRRAYRKPFVVPEIA